MAAPLQHVQNQPTRLSLTVNVTADADRIPTLTADLLRALNAFGDQQVTVTETPTRSGVLVALPGTRAPLRVLVDARRVLWHGEEIALTRLEFDLLLFLAANPGRVHRRRGLMTEVWHTSYVSERTVDVHIRRLRGKLGPALVRTVRGVGYQFGDPSLVSIEQGE
ncbi:winged helix-turn-helix domain-containing protein [Actinokineospora iranica]|uniref:Transcriptional regulatory protein, C terminal n=1 Tax=Actinokineospora iranica TaxID=1271860 RepID=A0A1G6WZP7_9PSEU|nr:winged helix-turn-helix domain-containing protein [Actinokineospora iranica]SDD71358.1 Transcriptional regulatory protein, C terminal [Actinokineospora iranica]